MTPRPLLYLAGPYTHNDPVTNTHAAAKAATIIYAQTQWVPMVPHLSLLWHLIDPQPVAHWYELDLHYLARCVAITRMPGPSTGADAEVIYARQRGLAVIDWDEMPAGAIRAWGNR